MSAASRIPFGPLLVAVAALAATLATIGPEGNGPGVTCDEPYHVNQGKELVTALRQQGLAFFLPDNIRRNFDWPPDGPPVQAPLGHWILGGTHWLMDPAPDDPSLLSITSARFAPAVAFALLVLMVGWWTARREGRWRARLPPRPWRSCRGCSRTPISRRSTCSPRVFFVAAVLAVTEAARGGRGLAFRPGGSRLGRGDAGPVARLVGRPAGGLVAALAFLAAEAHGLQPVGLEGLSVAADEGVGGVAGRRRGNALSRLAVVVAGPVGPLPAIRGQRLRPAAVARLLLGPGLGRPRRALALPLGHLRRHRAGRAAGAGHGGAVGGIVWPPPQWRSVHGTPPQLGDVTSPPAVSSHAEREEYILLAATMVFVLAVFSWPGMPVYDGERLFLMVFPLWAVWVGIGARRLIARGGSRPCGWQQLRPFWRSWRSKGLACSFIIRAN